MELVEGETIAARLKSGPLLLKTSLLYASKTVAALAEAQRKANESGLDVGLFPIDLLREWTTRCLPARQYRTGDDTLMADGHHCQIVRPV